MRPEYRALVVQIEEIDRATGLDIRSVEDGSADPIAEAKSLMRALDCPDVYGHADDIRAWFVSRAGIPSAGSVTAHALMYPECEEPLPHDHVIEVAPIP